MRDAVDITDPHLAFKQIIAALPRRYACPSGDGAWRRTTSQLWGVDVHGLGDCHHLAAVRRNTDGTLSARAGTCPNISR